MKLRNQLFYKSLVAFSVTAIIFAACKKSDTGIETQSITDDGSQTISANSHTGNANPVIKTGADQTYSVAVSTITLDGSRSYDPDGSIESYLWIKDFGPGNSTITSPNSGKTTVTGLTTGIYRFKLQITDNGGVTVTDTIRIMNGNGSTTTPPPPPPPGNQSPVVNAGSSQTITLPASVATLNGSATDADGTIASYLWTKISGNGGNITSPNSASTTVAGLTAGSYVFNLKATDNAGASGNKTVSVIVNSASTPPPTGGSYGTLIYSTGFNTTSDIINSSNQQGNGGLSTSIYKTGPGSFKSVPASVSSGIRSEVQYSSSLTPTEGAIEYDVMYETIFSGQGHSLQFHPNTSGGSASPGLWHEGGKFTWVNWKDGTNTKHTTNFTIPKNKWMHVVFEYKIGSAGYMKFTIDGVVVLNKTNIQVGDGSGQYLKVGVNMWASQSSVVYYDNLKIWKK